MTIEIREYEDADKDDWEYFLKRSNNGTIFHSLDFLAYHPKGKFNENHLIFTKKGNIISVFPAAIFYDEYGKKILKSPYGASFGGFVTPPFLSLRDSLDIVNVFLSYTKEQGISEIYITPPPIIYQNQLNNQLDFALIVNNFVYTNREITSVINLENIGDRPLGAFKTDAKRSIKKSQKIGVKIEISEDYETSYNILLENRKKFNATPTHTLKDLLWLKRQLPDNFVLFMAYLENKAIASAHLFICNQRVILAFYVSILPDYTKYRAVNLLMYDIILWAHSNEFKFIDWGTSTTMMQPNWSLIRFKESMCSTGFFRDTFYKKLLIE